MNQEYPIRVLHRGMSYNRGGIESYLINYYRHWIEHWYNSILLFQKNGDCFLKMR